MELAEIVDHLESLAGRRASADWWYRAVRDGLVLQACRRAVKDREAKTLGAFSQLVASPAVSQEVQIRFDERSVKRPGSDPDRIDSVRFHNLLAACALSAQLTAQTSWELPVTADVLSRVVDNGQGGIFDLLDRFNAFLRKANRANSQALLLSWVNDWLAQPKEDEGEGEKARAARKETYAVPIASVGADGMGVMAQLILRPFGAGAFAHQVFPDIDVVFSYTGDQFLLAIDESVPADLGVSVAWSVQVPSNLKSAALLGRSVRGAAAFAFDALRRDKAIPPGILVIADVRGGKLCGVGGERAKIAAAVQQYNRELFRGTVEQKSDSLVELIVLSRDPSDASAREAAAFIKTRNCEDLEAIYGEARDHVESVQGKIHRVSRRFNRLTAIAPPAQGDFRVQPGIGEARVFHPDCRVDYTSTVQVSTRSTGIFPLHYKAVAPQALIDEARGYSEPPLSDTELGLEHPDIESYRESRRHFKMQFVPVPGVLYGLTVATYGCFDENNRDVHGHLWGDTYYEEVIEELDLRGVLRGSHHYKLSLEATDAPVLRIWRWPRGFKTDSCAICKKEAKDGGQLVEATVIEPGLWRWEARGVRHGGALLMEWNSTIKRVGN